MFNKWFLNLSKELQNIFKSFREFASLSVRGKKLLIEHGLAPKYFLDLVSYNSDIHPYFTRNSNNIYISRTNTTGTMNSLLYKGFDNFNKLPTELKLKTSLNMYRKNLKNYVANRI
uniref:Uncharacterized protein LOC114336568 n=1 Tax=Diabrotica virgifera virgifera TaxID=50390 RepID=A0A6P7G1D0_DIAVI